MSSRRYRLAPRADLDIEAILQETVRMFGPMQRRKYAILILQALEHVAREPAVLGSRSCDEILPGLRSFHVERTAGRRGAAAHVVYYEEATFSDGSQGVSILRVLHERMEPGRHIAGGSD